MYIYQIYVMLEKDYNNMIMIMRQVNVIHMYSYSVDYSFYLIYY